MARIFCVPELLYEGKLQGEKKSFINNSIQFNELSLEIKGWNMKIFFRNLTNFLKYQNHTCSVQQWWPLKSRSIVKIILCKCLVSSFHARSNALGWFIGELNGHLKKSNWEIAVSLGSHPQTERILYMLRLNQYIDDFSAEIK